jgi:hypothetical protein
MALETVYRGMPSISATVRMVTNPITGKNLGCVRVRGLGLGMHPRALMVVSSMGLKD